ncbi:MAG: hypothetical protein QGH11_03820, partial [Pirellulaceae bacterium]|nr:hypothetical protein [Pirellulaceae bacterium]
MNELVPFECPYCSHQMEIREGLDGKDGTCSGCNRMVTFSLSSWQSGEGRQQAEDGSPPGPPPPAGAATFAPRPPPPPGRAPPPRPARGPRAAPPPRGGAPGGQRASLVGVQGGNARPWGSRGATRVPGGCP